MDDMYRYLIIYYEMIWSKKHVKKHAFCLFSWWIDVITAVSYWLSCKYYYAYRLLIEYWWLIKLPLYFSTTWSLAFFFWSILMHKISGLIQIQSNSWTAHLIVTWQSVIHPVFNHHTNEVFSRLLSLDSSRQG
mgnify:CR=1 FL=1